MHFLGIHWDSFDKKPYLKYRDKRYDTNLQLLKIKVYENISFKILNKRYCIGHTDGGSEMNHLCKTAIADNELLTAQCDACRLKDSLYFTHLNGLNISQLNELKNRKSINYINVFGNKLLKTGVTGVDRKITRVLEQGAVATIFFTLTDAYTSRIIENLITNVLNIKQAYSWNTKLKYLLDILSKNEAENLLKSTYLNIKDLLSQDYKMALLNIPEYHYNFDKYYLSIPNNIKNLNLTEHLSYYDIISGKIIGVYGQIIFIQQNDETIIGLNAKSMQGFLIEISNDLVKTKLNINPKIIEIPTNIPENMTLF